MDQESHRDADRGGGGVQADGQTGGLRIVDSNYQKTCFKMSICLCFTFLSFQTMSSDGDIINVNSVIIIRVKVKNCNGVKRSDTLQKLPVC